MTQQACQWRQTNDPYMPDTWEADCGAMWTFTDGAPKDNHMRFCPQCGHPLQQIDNAMNHKSDPYASEAETQALLQPDARTPAERKLDEMMDELGAWEHGAEPYPLLRHIALELLEKQLAGRPAQHRSTGKQSLQVEHPAWPAPLLQSKQNFERNFGQHWQADWIYSDLAELIDSPPPEQPATTKCWKCGDADPAFTDVCQVPACGMREQP